MTIIIDGADKGATRTSLGLAIGTDVLAPSGSAASLTNIPAAQLTGTVPDASLSSATIPASQISGVVAHSNLGTGGSATTFLRGDGTFAAAGGGGCFLKSASGSFTNQAAVTFTNLPNNCRITVDFTVGMGNPLSAQVSTDNGSTFVTSNTYRHTERDLVNGLTGWVHGSTSTAQTNMTMGATGFAEIFWWAGQRTDVQTLLSWRMFATQGAAHPTQGSWTNMGHGFHNANEAHNAFKIFQAGNITGTFCVDEWVI